MDGCALRRRRSACDAVPASCGSLLQHLLLLRRLLPTRLLPHLCLGCCLAGGTAALRLDSAGATRKVAAQGLAAQGLAAQARLRSVALQRRCWGAGRAAPPPLRTLRRKACCAAAAPQRKAQRAAGIVALLRRRREEGAKGYAMVQVGGELSSQLRQRPARHDCDLALRLEPSRGRAGPMLQAGQSRAYSSPGGAACQVSWHRLAPSARGPPRRACGSRAGWSCGAGVLGGAAHLLPRGAAHGALVLVRALQPAHHALGVVRVAAGGAF
jgi:hypothetical protein